MMTMWVVYTNNQRCSFSVFQIKLYFTEPEPEKMEVCAANVRVPASGTSQGGAISLVTHI
jgi:hypothetical protein